MRRVVDGQDLDNDVFNTMPLSAQALYYRLHTHADNDGFVASPVTHIRAIGAAIDDLNVLLDTRYVLGFNTGVVVMKHWFIHNSVRKDRYKPTTYQDEYSCLDIKENGSYTPNKKAYNTEGGCHLVAKWLPNGCPNTIQYNTIQTNTLKSNVQTVDTVMHDTPKSQKEKPDFDKEFEQLWKKYPNKKGKADALRHYKVHRRKHTYEEIDKKLDEYISYIKVKHIDPEYILNGSTWFNGRWLDEYDIKTQNVSYDLDRVREKANEPIVYKRRA